MRAHRLRTPRLAKYIDTPPGCGQIEHMRIALIHALKHSIVPIEASFARLWPDASLMNLLDDSLSADVARDGRLTVGDDRSFPDARTLCGLDRR